MKLTRSNLNKIFLDYSEEKFQECCNLKKGMTDFPYNFHKWNMQEEKKKNQKLVMVMRGLAASVSSRYHRVQKCIFLIFKIMIPFYKKKKIIEK